MASASERDFVRRNADWLFPGALAVAVASAYFAQKLDKKGRPWAGLGVQLVPSLLFMLICFLLADWPQVPDDVRNFILFLAIFPLINGLFDFFSYAVTLTLITVGLTRGARAVMLGFADLGLAALLFVGLGASLVLSMAGLAHLAGEPLIDLVPLFDTLRSDPLSEWWVIFMVFSTLLPTGLHLLLACFAVQGLVPGRWRRWVAKRIERSEHDSNTRLTATFCLAAVWTLPATIFLSLVFISWHFADDVLSEYATWYLDQMRLLAFDTGAL